MKSEIFINPQIQANEFSLKYYIDYSDYLKFVVNNDMYMKSGSFCYRVRLDRIYSFFPVSLFYRGVIGTLHVVNLQLALGYIDQFIETKDQEALQYAEGLVSEIMSSGNVVQSDSELVLKHDFYQPSYMLLPSWPSGMAQGELISVLTRLWKITGKDEYLAWSYKALEPMIKGVGSEGCAIRTNNNGLWIEEYPNKSFPNFVLNGFIFSIFGLNDLKNLGYDKAVTAFDDSLNALKSKVEMFISEKFSYYDLAGTIADGYYNHLHCIQLRVLANITNDKWFENLSVKFERLQHCYIHQSKVPKKSLYKRWQKLRSLLLVHFANSLTSKT